MDLKALRESPIGELVEIAGVEVRTGSEYEHFAYLPRALPAEVALTAGAWKLIAKAEASLARLDQAARQLPDARLLSSPALRREAHSTTALEGTHAPLEEVLESDPEDVGRLPTDVREVINYVITAEAAFGAIAENPISSRMICGLQARLVAGTRAGSYSDAGRIRERDVFIGARDRGIKEARFVPAPHGARLADGFESWVAWINAPPEDFPPVLQAALAHYQFETLHPFSDGNGRIGRLIIVLQLMQLGVLVHPMLVVSPWFEERKDEYQDALLRLSCTGEFEPWVRFFATGVEAAATNTHERVDALLDWQADARERAQVGRASGVAERVASELIGTPILRASQVAKRYGVTTQAAMNALRRLVELDLLAEVVRPNGRIVFRAPEVISRLRM